VPNQHLQSGSNQLGKEAKYQLKILKAIMLVAIAASALSLGACAHKNETATTSSTSSTRGYSK
jgi:hypothetical protein